MANGPSVFISHAAKDAHATQLLVSALRARAGNAAPDFEAFLDLDDVTPSRSFVAQISDAIDRATAAVVVLSPAFFSSAYTSRELSLLFRRKERDPNFVIVPVLLETTDPPGFLKGQAYVDARQKSAEEVADALVAVLEGRSAGTNHFKATDATEYRERLDAIRRTAEREESSADELGKLTRF